MHEWWSLLSSFSLLSNKFDEYNFFKKTLRFLFINKTQVNLALILFSFNFESRLRCFGFSFVLNIFSLKYCNYKNRNENSIETHLIRKKKFDDNN